MLNNKGFDLWADGYDKTVGLSDEDGTYPFAGYREILNAIYRRVLSGAGKSVMDIGFGTAALTSKLYERGFTVYGQDFSERMLELAQEKMPEAHLYLGDFSRGLADALKTRKYDAIIATYSLHHLTDPQKVDMLHELRGLLNADGHIYIGDVAFETRAELELCKSQVGDEWDDDEIYFVFDELKPAFCDLQFQRISFCAGLLSLPAQP